MAFNFGTIGSDYGHSFPLFGTKNKDTQPTAAGGYISFNATPNPQDEMRLNKRLAENPMVAAGLTNVG